MHKIELGAIGAVVCNTASERDDDWGTTTAEIHLDPARFEPAALAGLADFSHVEVIFYFHNVKQEKITHGARHPRENPAWPRVGIFAQRASARPSRIGATICEVLSVEGLTLRVRALDAFDGTPVLDLKPVMAEFLPDKKAIRQPQWSRELMTSYF